MTLGELIAALEGADQDLVVPRGFARPHSYRGYYNDVAFEPEDDVKVSDLLASAREALGSTYQGWKGGDYTMTEHVDVYLANQGDCGEELGPTLLLLMLAEGVGGGTPTTRKGRIDGSY